MPTATRPFVHPAEHLSEKLPFSAHLPPLPLPIDVASVEFVLRAALQDSVEDDFVHSITGKVIAEPKTRGEENAGQISASLVHFSEALDHGISAERLSDGISGDISEYWEHLFDVETGCPKEEIQNEFEVVDLDLLIIDYVAIYPEFRGQGIAESVIHRTIDIFGAGCGMVACKPGRSS